MEFQTDTLNDMKKTEYYQKCLSLQESMRTETQLLAWKNRLVTVATSITYTYRFAGITRDDYEAFNTMYYAVTACLETVQAMLRIFDPEKPEYLPVKMSPESQREAMLWFCLKLKGAMQSEQTLLDWKVRFVEGVSQIRSEYDSSPELHTISGGGFKIINDAIESCLENIENMLHILNPEQREYRIDTSKESKYNEVGLPLPIIHQNSNIQTLLCRLYKYV